MRGHSRLVNDTHILHHGHCILMISSLRKMNQITSIPNVTEKGKIKIKRKDRRKRGKCSGRASRLSSDARFSPKARSREQSVLDRFPLLLLVVYSFTF